MFYSDIFILQTNPARDIAGECVMGFCINKYSSIFIFFVLFLTYTTAAAAASEVPANCTSFFKFIFTKVNQVFNPRNIQPECSPKTVTAAVCFLRKILFDNFLVRTTWLAAIVHAKASKVPFTHKSTNNYNSYYSTWHTHTHTHKMNNRN